MTKAQVDSLMLARNIKPTNFNKAVIYQLHRIAQIGMGQFMQLLRKNISYMMFILMPVLGVLIYLFNRNRINYYLESLVISIHFHSFVFLFFTIILLVNLIINQSLIFLLWIIIPPVYMLLMFMKYFEYGFWITAVKTFFIGILYNVTMVVFIILTFIVSIILV